ncbi:MAG: tetratricopeptide repeat protein, partial [Prochlorothrix sp.]
SISLYSIVLIKWSIAIVQDRIQAGTRNSQLYLLEAEAYLAMDLPLEARQSFQQALALAEVNAELERQADSYRGLGEIAARQTEETTARELFQKALALYEKLEDSEQTRYIQTELEQLDGQ